MKRLSLLSALWLLPVGSARAFSEPTLYTELTPYGGGGGRFFTGSPLDGFTCSVCHQGGPKPQVSITGFPDSFEPGESYDIMVRWTQPASPHSLNLEVVDREGRAAGSLALPDADQLADDDRCVLAEDPDMQSLQASYLMSYGERSVLGVRGCGARALHFTFTAPSDDEIALTASILRSDRSEDPTGDGVLAVRTIARRVGAPITGPIVGSCAASGRGEAAGERAGLGNLLLVLAATLLGSRRRRLSASRG